jgi:DNA (cytosine-5)-methyltransferase 1
LFEFPAAMHGEENNLIPFVTVKDAISDLDFIPDDKAWDECIDYRLPDVNDYQKLMRKKSKKLYNHVAVIHKKRTKEIIAMVPDGGNYKTLPKELWETRKVHIVWTRMNSSRPCFTIDAGHNHHFHYKENRVSTVRESARIQSFSDSFVFYGIKTRQFHQVGNAVPPIFAKAVAKKVYSIGHLWKLCF